MSEKMPEPVRVVCSDALTALRELPSNSVHSLVTDPPAGIGFMGKAWDSDKGGRDQWTAWLAEIMQEAIRVLKPGAFGLVWALPRTSGWTQRALEDAGFEIRDVVTHLFSTGFPKSLDVSKAIEKMHGAEREIIGTRSQRGTRNDGFNACSREVEPITVPSTYDAKAWNGYGTALKPAAEFWILVRKPLAESTVAKNVLAHGVGALNIDVSRIGTHRTTTTHTSGGLIDRPSNSPSGGGTGARSVNPPGRFPANVVLSHTTFCVQVGERTLSGESRAIGEGTRNSGFYNIGTHQGNGKPCGPAYGGENIDVWECPPGCVVRELDEQSGQRTSGKPCGKRRASSNMQAAATITDLTGFGDTGGASRFFYVSKPPKSEKRAGLDDVPDVHPTVKPVELMRYFINLVTPAGGTVLDPFAGSGTTLVAAALDGFGAIGIERESAYAGIATARVAWAIAKREATPAQATLFAV